MVKSGGEEIHCLHANWIVPENVKAMVTTRSGGNSEGIYNSFNLAKHVGDNIEHVDNNREQLVEFLNLQTNPFWLKQTHSDLCIPWSDTKQEPQADASFATGKYQVCTVMTADCLPVLLCNKQGSWVAACHAGWRGLVDGVIENTVNCYRGNKSDLVGWIGPSICADNFEVGNEVKQAFVRVNSVYEKHFYKNQHGRYQFDMIALAERILSSFGIDTFVSNQCSYQQQQHFYSYRRDGKTGRMASLIWLE